MTRIVAISSSDPAAPRGVRLAEMLSAFSGRQETGFTATASLGAARHAPGGVARGPRGVLALDGLFYDLAERRAELGMADAGDAAVLMALAARHGPAEAAAVLNGDFAFVWAVPDSADLWVGRDAFGMRPLYYARLEDGWAVASQPRALLRLTGIDDSPDRGFLARFGAMHYRLIDNDPDASPYAAVAQVPAGHVLRLRADGRVEKTRVWGLTDAPDWTAPEAELAERYRALLIDAVSRRLARFPNRGFTLSGGMDSSSVLACAVEVAGEPQIVHSSLYEDHTYDERDEIADMLDRHIRDWRRVVVPNDIDVVADVDRMVTLHDEPVATATWLSHMRLCARAEESGFDSLFGGLGGDELNAGEYEYFPLHFADLAQAGETTRLTAEIAAWARHHDHPIFRKTPKIARALMARLTDPAAPGTCLPDLARLTRYLDVLGEGFAEFRSYRPVMEAPFASYLKSRTYQDLTRETIPCCIRAEDRHGAAFGLPPVLPFLDRRLVEFMYRVPGAMKIRDGVTKRLLREATRGLLPEATRARVKKTGWNAPAHLWFTGRGDQAIRDLVASDLFRDLGLYRRERVLAILDEHQAILRSGKPRENHMMFLWQFLNLMRWQAWVRDRGYARSARELVQ